MNFVLGVFIGMIASFIIGRIADKTCKTSAMEHQYDCDSCTAHCVGYHCHVMREMGEDKPLEN